MNLSIQNELQLFAEELFKHLTPSFLENLAKELGVVQHRHQAKETELTKIHTNSSPTIEY